MNTHFHPGDWLVIALQHSADLINWTNVPNADQPHMHDLSAPAAGFRRMKR